MIIVHLEIVIFPLSTQNKWFRNILLNGVTNYCFCVSVDRHRAVVTYVHLILFMNIALIYTKCCLLSNCNMINIWWILQSRVLIWCMGPWPLVMSTSSKLLHSIKFERCFERGFGLELLRRNELYKPSGKLWKSPMMIGSHSAFMHIRKVIRLSARHEEYCLQMFRH